MAESEEAAVFRYMIARLTPSRKAVCEGMVYAISHARSAHALSALLAETPLGTAPLQALKARLYLASDIIYNSNTPETNSAWTYRSAMVTVVPELFEMAKAYSETRADASLESLCALLLRLWRDWGPFEPRVLKGLASIWQSVPESTERQLRVYLGEYTRALCALSDLDLEHLCKRSGVALSAPRAARIKRLATALALDVDMRSGAPQLPVVEVDTRDSRGVPVEKVVEAFHKAGVCEVRGLPLSQEDFDVLARLDRTGGLQVYSNSYVIR